MKTLTRISKKLQIELHTTATHVKWMIGDRRLDNVQILGHELIVTTEWHTFTLDLDAEFYEEFQDPIFRYQYETNLLKLLKPTRRRRRRR